MHGSKSQPELVTKQDLEQLTQEGDLAPILALLSTCEDAPSWPIEAWQAFLIPQSTQDLVRRLLLGIRSADDLIGLIAFTLIEHTTELGILLVRPSRRRQGLGTMLSGSWLRWASDAGASEALLEVRASNAGAQALYRELGFVDAGCRKEYYRQPSEDALLMRTELSH